MVSDLVLRQRHNPSRVSGANTAPVSLGTKLTLTQQRYDHGWIGASAKKGCTKPAAKLFRAGEIDYHLPRRQCNVEPHPVGWRQPTV
jgi:hypothetical protein